jgi:hypothetical protein
MALLLVTADTNSSGVPSGTRDHVFLLISVTDRNGKPITGLTFSPWGGPGNIQFKDEVVARGGSGVEINPNPHGYYEPAPGFYQVEFIPAAAWTWIPGKWTILIHVKQGQNEGQTITSFAIT